MTERDRKVLTAVIVLAAIVGAWLLFIAPKRSEAGRLGTQISAEQRQLTAEQAAVAGGEAARSQYKAYSSQLSRLSEAVPSDDDVPQLIYEVQGAAQAAGVDFRSLALAQSASPAATTPAPPAAGSAGVASSTATAGTTAAGTTAGATSTGLPPGVSLSPTGLPEEPFNFTFNGSFFHLSDFLGRLQRFVTATEHRIKVSGRLMTLNSISLAAGPQGFPQIAATVNATTYLVPQSTLNTAVQ